MSAGEKFSKRIAPGFSLIVTVFPFMVCRATSPSRTIETSPPGLVVLIDVHRPSLSGTISGSLLDALSCKAQHALIFESSVGLQGKSDRH